MLPQYERLLMTASVEQTWQVIVRRERIEHLNRYYCRGPNCPNDICFNECRCPPGTLVRARGSVTLDMYGYLYRFPSQYGIGYHSGNNPTTFEYAASLDLFNSAPCCPSDDWPPPAQCPCERPCDFVPTRSVHLSGQYHGLQGPILSVGCCWDPNSGGGGIDTCPDCNGAADPTGLPMNYLARARTRGVGHFTAFDAVTGHDSSFGHCPESEGESYIARGFVSGFVDAHFPFLCDSQVRGPWNDSGCGARKWKCSGGAGNTTAVYDPQSEEQSGQAWWPGTNILPPVLQNCGFDPPGTFDDRDCTSDPGDYFESVSYVAPGLHPCDVSSCGHAIGTKRVYVKVFPA